MQTVIVYIALLFGNGTPTVVVDNLATERSCMAIVQVHKAGSNYGGRCIRVIKIIPKGS